MSRQTHTDNYYLVLGVDPSATPDEITKAFRGMALKMHPDKNHGEGATAAFQLLNQAHDVLKDRVQRQQYDAYDYPLISRNYGSSSQAPWAKKGLWPQKPPKSQTEQKHTTRRQAFAAFPSGDQIYELKDGKRFNITATMIARGRMELHCQDIEDRSAKEKDGIRFQEFSREILSKSPQYISLFEISDIIKKDPVWVEYIEGSQAAAEKRAQEYFKNAFPELLGPFGTLPDGWKSLWETFKRENLSPYEIFPDAMSEAAAEAREKQQYDAAENKRKHGLDEHLKGLWNDFEKKHGTFRSVAARDTMPTDEQICAAIPTDGISFKDLMAHFKVSKSGLTGQTKLAARINALCTRGPHEKIWLKPTQMEDTEMGGI